MSDGVGDHSIRSEEIVVILCGVGRATVQVLGVLITHDVRVVLTANSRMLCIYPERIKG